MKRRAGFLILIFLAVTLPLASWELQGIEGRMGLVWYGYAADTKYTASPLKASLGVTVPMKISSRYEFHPELEMFFFPYVWDTTLEAAVPAALETADRISVLHLLINPAFFMFFPLDPEGKLSYGFSLSPAFLFRIPIAAADDGAATRKDLTKYLYSSLRFFYPAAGALLKWKFREKLIVTVGTNVYLPVFHLWDGSGRAFYDQLIITGTAGFQVPF